MGYADRLWRAAKLDIHLYEEVEKDPGAMKQAMGTVVLASLAAGIGGAAGGSMGGLVLGTISALAGWYIWALLIYYIGTRWLPEEQTSSSHGELLRTLGFASAPGIFRVAAIIPGLAFVIFLVTSVWMLITMVIAVRQALDYQSTMRAVGVCVIGWIIQTALIFVVVAIFGQPGS